MDILLILPIIQAFDIRADYEQFPNPLPVTSQKKMYSFENQAVMEYKQKVTHYRAKCHLLPSQGIPFARQCVTLFRHNPNRSILAVLLRKTVMQTSVLTCGTTYLHVFLHLY